MGQRNWVLHNILCTLLLIGCDRSPPAASSQPSAPPGAQGMIVSLSPAASDLLVGMGLTDRVVGVSAYEAMAPLKKLPVVGDYQRIDWEQMARLKPAYLIVQGRADRLPAGLQERAAELGIKLVNIQIDRLDDIYRASEAIGAGVASPEAGKKYAAELRKQVEGSRKPAAAPVPALILLGERGVAVIGRDNYLNDLLVAAGGSNVIEMSGYPTIDREKLLTLKPEVVFVLLPGASEQVIKDATTVINSATELPAVKNRRVHVITSTDALLPASPVATMAATFAEKLHPSTDSSTRPAAP